MIYSPKTILQQDGMKIAVAVIIVLAAVAIYFGSKAFNADKRIEESRKLALSQCQNQKDLDFALLFIDKVLQSDKEVDFDTRLDLENKVRALNDKEILARWQQFTAAQDEKDAQQQVKNLLRLLIEKTKLN